MNLLQRLRGPRLGTKLAMLGLALLVIPWFSYRQLVEMERILIQSQSQTQLLTAEGISTLFNGREEFFNDLPISLEDFEPLYAHPLASSVRFDGLATDWDEAAQNEYLQFGTPEATADGDFKLLLGEHGDDLYVHMKIHDDQLILRDADYLRLDNADHLRVNFMRTDGEDGRVSLVLEDESTITGFEMDEDFRYAATGTPDRRIKGALKQQGDEIWIEFKFPLALLGSRTYFGISWVDVDDPVSREIHAITQTLPKTGGQSFNLVVLSSPEVRNIIQGLGYSGARILVIDSKQRVRAETGTIRPTQTVVEDDSWPGRFTAWFEHVRPWLHAVVMGEEYSPADASAEQQAAEDQSIASSLAGEPIALRTQSEAGADIILAAHPIVSSDAVIGSVVVEQNIDDILAFQRDAIEQVLFLSVLSLLLVFIALVAFAGRLAWRIRNLRREASAAIDSHGRLRTSELQNEMSAGDEIGDLARSVSNMLSRLHRHNTFLESMPRTLRHEINNPLNTMSTSLQNLVGEHPELDGNKYLESAQRGVNRIGSIVQNLADAANLEDALESEELEEIDLNLLLKNYVANCSLVHKHCRFIYKGPETPAVALVADFRIEQMLDKIIDNAVDFHRLDSPIRVQLDIHREQLQITVANRGPGLPEAVERSVFDSMVSHRMHQNRLHFGLGLYVVRIIAEYHGGHVRAINLTDGSGVAVVVQLPLVHGAESNGQVTDKTHVPIVPEKVSAG